MPDTIDVIVNYAEIPVKVDVSYEDDVPTIEVNVNERALPIVGLDYANLLVIGEIPLGAINGVNATFVSQHPFIPETLEVYVNGLRQKSVDDYNTVGNTDIYLINSLTLGEHITINYIKA